METKSYIFFFGENNPNGWMSNFDTKAQFIDMNGNKFFSNEHYFMSRKAKQWPTPKNELIFNEITKSKTPKEAKALGRKVEKFDEKEWDSLRVDIMKDGLRYKFSDQNPMTLEYKKNLIATGNAILIEASPYDKIWGIGMKEKDAYKLNEEEWHRVLKERNLLGKALMEIRSELTKK